MKNKLILICFVCLTTLMAIGCNVDNQNAMDMGGHEASPHRGGQADSFYLSAESTDIPSHSFPHTRAVKIQDAVFEFEIDPAQFHLEELYDLDLDLSAVDLNALEQQLREHLQRGGQEPIELEIPQRQQAPEAGPQETAPEPQQPQQQPEEPQQAEQPQQQPEEPQQAEQPQQQQPGTQQAEQPQQQQTEEPRQAETEQQTQGLRQEERRVIELTNNHRREAGLSELQADVELSNVARRKSTDMQQNNYFSHTSPTYGSPFDMIRDHGITYNSAGENIAQGQRSPEEVVQAWMNSPGHRQNILNPNYTHIGVGYEPAGNHWTQMFISR
jgi:uncharacterized YkwD family protein